MSTIDVPRSNGVTNNKKHNETTNESPNSSPSSNGSPLKNGFHKMNNSDTIEDL